jgi:hypothetical protein
MTRQTLQHAVTTYVGLLALLVVATASGRDPGDEPTKEKKDQAAPAAETKADEQSRREAERVIRGIELEMLVDDKWTKVERIEKPLLFYGEPTRSHDRGSVWGWGRKGRPVALLELWQNVGNRSRWFFILCNTSGRKLRARRDGDLWWGVNDSAAELKDIPAATAPAADAPLRQRQLKLLAEKFSGHEFWDPNSSRYELRLLKRPLYTYRDEDSGVLEGGLFTLANGTNPEILFFVEARVDPDNRSKRIWQYTVGRLAHAELHLKYDGKEVFEAPRGNKVSGPDQPYWLSFLIAPAEADSEKP